MSAPPPAPEFIVTNLGLAVASVATPVGPFIHVTGFRIGDGYGYVALPTDTDLNGNLLYEGQPSTYQYVGDNTLDIVCKIPAEAGPWDFGEICIDLAGPTMFAKAVFAIPQTKYSSLGTNVQSTYTFHCLLKLQQSVAVFKIDTISGDPPSIWEVDFWKDVYPPALMANPLIPAILVRELDTHGNSSLIHQASDAHWSMGTNYHFIGSTLATGGSLTAVTVNTSVLGSQGIASNILRNYVVELSDGYMRACSSVTLSGSTYTFTFTDPLDVAPLTSSPVSVYCNTPEALTILNITGDASGSAVLSPGQVNLSLTLNQQAIQGRTQTYSVAGEYDFIVPENVTTLFLDGGGGGGGGAGAGGGFSTDHVNGTDYQAGGGGGGGGAGETVTGATIAVTPGEVVHIVIGARGVGGQGGAPGNNATSGTDGGDTVVGPITLAGGQGGSFGAGNGAPSGLSGAGGSGGNNGGFFGFDGAFGGSGGNGGTSTFGAGGAGARAATIGDPSNTPKRGIDGAPGTGNCSGGGAGGAIYVETSTTYGGNGNFGTDGLARLTW